MRHDLEEYQKRKQIIVSHREELEECAAADTVMGSMRNHPYTERVITIIGRDEKREKQLRQRINELSQQCAKAEAYVASVEDEQMRALLYWHYIQGLSWPKVRRRLRMRDVTVSCLRMRVERFFQKNT